jgi:hypothetical protein
MARSRDGYDFDKTKCDNCPSSEGLRLSTDGGALCGRCHREKLLTTLLDRPLKCEETTQ